MHALYSLSPSLSPSPPSLSSLNSVCVCVHVFRLQIL